MAGIAAATAAAGGIAGVGAALMNRKKKEKTASMAERLTHGAEIAGLGILAAPSIAEMRGKKVSDKTKHRAEVAGLGVLAVPSAAHLAHDAYGKIKSKLVKKVAFVDQVIGGVVGHHYGTKQRERGEAYSFGGKQLASALLLPGGLGYQIGRHMAHNKGKKKKAKK